jgi:hypothetical protein
MHKKYRIRHKILGTLQEKLSRFDMIAEVDPALIELTLSDLANIAKRPEKEILNQVDYLLLQKEVGITRIETGIKVLILESGSAAYFDSKYPDEGRKVFWNNLFEVTKTISNIILLIFAIITFITGILRSQQTAEDIRQLQQQVENLKRNQDPILEPAPVTGKSPRKQ